MYKLLALSFLYCLIQVHASAQSKNHGLVVDGFDNLPLRNSSVSVLRARDSILITTTRTDLNGNFELERVPSGKYLLLISYPGYLNVFKGFEAEGTPKAFGKISLLQKAKILKEIIIKGNASNIKINGDTTEYNAKDINVEPNAKVEDLLKRFPGMRVGKDGRITANGKTVEKVLVDGEEFFGDDPTLVTRNLRADMVDKIQLFEKTSDQAALTGVDDGKKSTTLNVKLKVDKKAGYFGKIEGGIGFKRPYQGQATYNTFENRKKIAVYGTLSNTGKIGLGADDQEQSGPASNNIDVINDGSLYIYGSSKDDLETFEGKFSGQGIPNTKNGGVFYSNKWKNKISINSNYRVGYINVNGVVDVESQNNLPDNQINSKTEQVFDKSMFRHKVDFAYENIIDTTLTLKVSFNFGIKNSKSSSNFTNVAVRDYLELINSGTRNLTNDVDENKYNLSFLVIKKFRKKGRTLSLNLINNYNNTSTDGVINSQNLFFNSLGQVDSTLIVDQSKQNHFETKILTSSISYSEPITKSVSFVTSINTSLNSGYADRRSFNQSILGNYDLLDLNFSNELSLNQWLNTLGINVTYRKGKSVVTTSGKIGGTTFRQTNLVSNQVYNDDFLYSNAGMSYLYKFSGQKSIKFSYLGMSNLPTLDQLQPVTINIDPLNLTIGNPTLRPSFKNSLGIVYNSFKVINSQSFYLAGNYSLYTNSVVNEINTDESGKSTYMPINYSSQNPVSYSLYANIDRKLNSGVILGLNLQANGNKFYNKINNMFGSTTAGNYSTSIIITRYAPDNFDYWFSFGPSYSINQSSFNPRLNGNGWSFNLQYNSGFYLTKNLEIRAEGFAQFRNRTAVFSENFHRIIINPSVAKTFSRHKSLKLKITLNDLLNQNIGLTRNATNGLVTQSQYSTIKRYLLLSASWDFNKLSNNK